jgi:hypothetical protein
MTMTQETLPPFILNAIDRFAGPGGRAAVAGWLRDPNAIMTAPALGNMKASRVSFTYVLARQMIEERWSIRLVSQSCDGEGDGRFVYAIEARGHAFTYIARTYRWDGQEKIGRRSDGANRDMFGALFVGTPDAERIAREFETFELRDADRMRTDAAVLGWTPANRSARSFDHVVDALAAGQQPLPDGAGYLLRNGGFQGSGRNGSISYPGIPDAHPLRHPFFADLFALYLVRQVSIDLVNAIALARNPRAARLSSEIARSLGVGNSSGQGMCVALQRWPHWVSTWLTVKEAALAYAKSRPVADATRLARLRALVDRAAAYYRAVELPCEDYVVPNAVIAANLATISAWLGQGPKDVLWGDFLARVEKSFDGETAEQVNALLIDAYPEFADAIAPFLVEGAERERRLQPAMPVSELRALLRSGYGWALTQDRSLASARQTFWYHSADNGEQRRGERILDPHEEFESFIDHIGLIQRLAAVLMAYGDATAVAEVIFDHPELHFAISRVQYLAGLAYAEIRDNLVHRDFCPAQLIRFFLGALGLECPSPLSIRYVRGVFFQGMPLPAELIAGAEADWRFRMSAAEAAEAVA